MWSFLNHPGNSSTPHRIGLIQRYLRVFGASSIKALLADREFIGDEWLSYLVESNIPFVIRLREDMHMRNRRRTAVSISLAATQAAQGTVDGLAARYGPHAGKSIAL